MGQLSSYRYFASRMILVSLLPALMYWIGSGPWVALKIFLGISLVTQLAALWVYRKDLISALRRRRR
jgi:hypothetical protein